MFDFSQYLSTVTMNRFCYSQFYYSVPAQAILESKRMRASFQKRKKTAKYLKIWAEMYKIWKYFEEAQVLYSYTAIKVGCRFKRD